MKLIKQLLEMNAASDNKSADVVKESADLAKKLVRGETSASGIMNKINYFVTWKLFLNKEKSTFLPAAYAIDQLKKAGFNTTQIHLIRDIATQSAYVALENMKRKYPKEIVVPKYFGPNESAFQVFDLFLNVGQKLRLEFANLFQKLFDKKIDNIKDELNLIKGSNDESK